MPNVPVNSRPRLTAAMNCTLSGIGMNEFSIGWNTRRVESSAGISALRADLLAAVELVEEHEVALLGVLGGLLERDRGCRS